MNNRKPTGVCWSGLESYPDQTFTPSPEALARAQAAYLKALEREEARIAAYIARQNKAAA